MERRKFVIGAGALATGSAAAMGTGAFSSVEADRNLEAEVVSDDGAYLGVNATSDYAENTGDGIEFTFDQLNPDSLTEFVDVFEFENSGSQDIRVFVDNTDIPSELNFRMFPSEDGDGGVGGTLTGSGGTTDIPPSPNVGVVLEPGASVGATILFGAYSGSLEGSFDDDITIYAIADDSDFFPDSGPEDANAGTDPEENTVPIYRG